MRSLRSLESPDSIPTRAGPDPRRIFLLRCLYFLGGLTGATWGRFSTIYFNKVLHFSPAQIGFIEAAMPATRLISTPIWGVIADIFQAKKRVYLLTSFIASSILLLQAFPAIATGFVPVLLINLGLSAFVASGVLDAHCLEYLAEFGQTRKYGTIRLWTAVSWGVGNLIMGYVTDHYAFWLNFLLFGTMSFIQLVSIYCIIPSDTLSQKRTKIKTKVDFTGSDNDTLEDPLLLRTSIQQTESFFEENKIEEKRKEIKVVVLEEEEEEEEEIEEDKVPSSELFRMLCAPSFLFFLFEVSVIGAAVGVVERLLFVYLQSDLDASTFLCGLTVLTTVIFELPIFIYTDYLLKNLGHDGMFIVAMLCYCVRAFGYTLLTKETVWWVIPLEALHGPTFALVSGERGGGGGGGRSSLFVFFFFFFLFVFVFFFFSN